MINIDGINPLKFTNTSILVHMSAAVILLFMTWGLVEHLYLFNWTAIVIVTLLYSLLGQSIFKRKNEVLFQNIKKWKTNYAYIAGIVSGILSVGYCYGVVIGDAALAKSLSFIMVLHISCITASSVGSKKIFVTSLLTLVIPFIATLLTLNNSTTLMLGISIAIFTGALILLNIPIHRSIILSVAMTAKYENEVKVSQQFKTKFEDMTFEDPLTQIFNRRFFNLMICEEIRRAKRAGTHLSIAIIEIDFFPEYLEHYGSAQGNQCVVAIAEILEKLAFRGGEFITRFEHNQFALIAPNVHTSEAIAFTTKMINLVNIAKLEHNYTLAENLPYVSISVGIAEFKADNIIDIDEMIEQSQSALKAARKLGHSNVQAFSRKVFSPKKALATDHNL